MTNPTTDLAARFEAKREECAMFEREAEEPFARQNWRGRTAAFAIARDMARAGAAGGAGEASEVKGFVSVPVNLTDEMRDAGVKGNRADVSYADVDEMWPAILAARPILGEIGKARANELARMLKQGLEECGFVQFRRGDEYGHITQDGIDYISKFLAEKPPAQQGSSSPPPTAERVDLGELERLSEAAARGPWSVSGTRRSFSEKSCVFIDAPSCAGLLVLATGDGAQALEALRDARFVVALVNAYRSGRLVPASLPGGTGSAEEGTDRPWFPISEAPADEEVEVRAGQMTFLAKLVPGGAMDTNENACDQWVATRDGEHPPCWSEGCCWTVNENEDRSLWPEAWRPAQGTEAGTAEAGTDSVHEGLVGEAEAPTPDPVGEAKALLEKVAQDQVGLLRHGALISRANGMRGTDDMVARADAIEAALATLHASQDQAGEVRS